MEDVEKLLVEIWNGTASLKTVKHRITTWSSNLLLGTHPKWFKECIRDIFLYNKRLLCKLSPWPGGRASPPTARNPSPLPARPAWIRALGHSYWYIWRDICTSMFITALFTIKRWEQAKCPAIWINKIWSTRHGTLFNLEREDSSDKCYNVVNPTDSTRNEVH